MCPQIRFKKVHFNIKRAKSRVVISSLHLFRLQISIINGAPACLHRLLRKVFSSILFKYRPIRTKVCLRTERSVKQTSVLLTHNLIMEKKSGTFYLIQEKSDPRSTKSCCQKPEQLLWIRHCTSIVKCSDRSP